MDSEQTGAVAAQHLTPSPMGVDTEHNETNGKRFSPLSPDRSDDLHADHSVDDESGAGGDHGENMELPSTDDLGSEGVLTSEHPDLQSDDHHHNDETHTQSNLQAASEGDLTSIATPALVALPCLMGKFTTEGSVHVCSGQWGMSKAAHEMPGQTSPFEFRLVQAANPAMSTFPVSGKYSGWFTLKQMPPKNPLKIDEKDLQFTFTPNAEGNYAVNGTGVNKFGKFSMTGTVTQSGDLEVYRMYEVKKTAQPKAPKRVKHADAPVSPTPPARRQSRGTWKDKTGAYDDFDQPDSSGAPEAPKGKRQAAAFVDERPKRMSEHLKRCGEILKILSKHPSAIWFRDPVDAIKLGIPDYLDIIKEPMDFGTIQSKLDNFEYETPERFAEHVRLVFRNAITYNQLRTNPVHVAARELSDQFEERYRIMISQLGSAGITSANPRSASKRQRVKSKARGSSSAGPRQYEDIGGYDPGMHQIADMQRQMEEMQKTIDRLKTEMKHKEPRPVAIAAASMVEPLTFEEKRHLIQQINNLPPDKLTRVVTIVQDALPAGPQDDDGEDVEIPLDNLDTHTLRKLQHYVESCMAPAQKRKRPAVQRQSIAQKYTVSQEKRHKSEDDPYDQSPYMSAEHASTQAATAAEPTGFFSGSAYSAELANGNGTDDSDDEHHNGAQNGHDFGAGNKRSRGAPAPRVASSTRVDDLRSDVVLESSSTTEESIDPPVKRARSDEIALDLPELALIDEHDNAEVTLQNTSAWTAAFQTPATSTDEPSKTTQGGGDANWMAAQAELQERQKRESMLKAQEEKMEEARQRADKERLDKLREEAQRIEQEKLRKIQEEEQQLEAERERARMERQAMHQTATTDQQYETLKLLKELENGL